MPSATASIPVRTVGPEDFQQEILQGIPDEIPDSPPMDPEASRAPNRPLTTPN